MRNWITLLAATMTTHACGQDQSMVAAANNVVGPSDANEVVGQPILGDRVNSATKLKPFVVDLGGRLIAEAKGCALTVSFGSIGTGTDTGTQRQIEQLLVEDRAVVEIDPYVVGREGETVLCIRLHAESEVNRVFESLRAIAANAYLVTIRSNGGRMFRSSGERSGT